jgi:UDP-2,3-diacylglucosamine hydrolase
MIKVAKPNQDMRFDVPVIGVETINVAAGSKLRVIAVESAKTLLLEKESVSKQALESGISIIGNTA